jgi:hypothetical protein
MLDDKPKALTELRVFESSLADGQVVASPFDYKHERQIRLSAIQAHRQAAIPF